MLSRSAARNKRSLRTLRVKPGTRVDVRRHYIMNGQHTAKLGWGVATDSYSICLKTKQTKQNRRGGTSLLTVSAKQIETNMDLLPSRCASQMSHRSNYQDYGQVKVYKKLKKQTNKTKPGLCVLNKKKNEQTKHQRLNRARTSWEWRDVCLRPLPPPGNTQGGRRNKQKSKENLSTRQQRVKQSCSPWRGPPRQRRRSGTRGNFISSLRVMVPCYRREQATVLHVGWGGGGGVP